MYTHKILHVVSLLSLRSGLSTLSQIQGWSLCCRIQPSLLSVLLEGLQFEAGCCFSSILPSVISVLLQFRGWSFCCSTLPSVLSVLFCCSLRLIVLWVRRRPLQSYRWSPGMCWRGCRSIIMLWLRYLRCGHGLGFLRGRKAWPEVWQ